MLNLKGLLKEVVMGIIRMEMEIMGMGEAYIRENCQLSRLLHSMLNTEFYHIRIVLTNTWKILGFMK